MGCFLHLCLPVQHSRQMGISGIIINSIACGFLEEWIYLNIAPKKLVRQMRDEQQSTLDNSFRCVVCSRLFMGSRTGRAVDMLLLS